MGKGQHGVSVSATGEHCLLVTREHKKAWDVCMPIPRHWELLKDMILVWLILGTQHCPVWSSAKSRKPGWMSRWEGAQIEWFGRWINGKVAERMGEWGGGVEGWRGQ